LPPRTASCAVYLLCGVPPLEAFLATLLQMVSNDPDGPLYLIGLHQLATTNSNSSSWFIYCAKRLAIYGMDALLMLQGKMKKVTIKRTILDHWTHKIREDIHTKSTLKYLNPDACDFTKPHPVWNMVDCNPATSRKAIQKVKLLTGTYTLQSNRAAFNQYQVSQTCPLCNADVEDRQHLLLQCPEMQVIRDKYMPGICSLIPNFYGYSLDSQISIILDSNFSPDILNLGECDRATLEEITRRLIYIIHCKRIYTLIKLNKGS
jgi:hypothetical protein